MSNYPSFHTFSGAVGFLAEVEQEKEYEEQRRRNERARLQELDDVYNAGVDEYNQLVKEYNELRQKYLKEMDETSKYRRLAIEIAKSYQAFYEEVKVVEDFYEQMNNQNQALNIEVNNVKTQHQKTTSLYKKVVNDATHLNNKLNEQYAENRRLAQLNQNLNSELRKQQLTTKDKDEKINQIKAGFHKVTSAANGEKLTLKFVFTKFKVLKNVIEHLISTGQLMKSNVFDIEQALIKRWDNEDNKLNTLTASEAGAYLASSNPELFNKLQIS